MRGLDVKASPSEDPQGRSVRAPHRNSKDQEGAICVVLRGSLRAEPDIAASPIRPNPANQYKPVNRKSMRAMSDLSAAAKQEKTEIEKMRTVSNSRRDGVVKPLCT